MSSLGEGANDKNRDSKSMPRGEEIIPSESAPSIKHLRGSAVTFVELVVHKTGEVSALKRDMVGVRQGRG